MLVPTARGLRSGVYMGWDGDRPTRCLDALVHEVDPGITSTIHRHSWDAILFMVEGSGWTEVDGVRYDWKQWDAIHIPAWSWHRHGNDGDRPGRFMSYSSEPMLWTLGMSVIEDRGHEPFASLPPRPAFSAGTDGRRSLLAALAAPGGGNEEAPLGPHPHALRRAGDPRHAARHAHQVPERPRHRQRGLGPHAGDDPVRARANPVAAPPPRRGLALRGRGPRPLASWAPRPTRASTIAGSRATSSSSTTSSGTSTSTTTRSTNAAWCASTCSTPSSRPCAR